MFIFKQVRLIALNHKRKIKKKQFLEKLEKKMHKLKGAQEREKSIMFTESRRSLVGSVDVVMRPGFEHQVRPLQQTTFSQQISGKNSECKNKIATKKFLKKKINRSESTLNCRSHRSCIKLKHTSL